MKYLAISLAWIAFGLSLVLLLGWAVNTWLLDVTVVLLTLSGAIGGLLYSGILDGKLENPKFTAEGLSPGLLLDCFTGAVGAWTIFLLLPNDFSKTLLLSNNPQELQEVLTQLSQVQTASTTGNVRQILYDALTQALNPVNKIKFMALGIIGGYGGRTIIDQAFGKILERFQGLEEKFSSIDRETSLLNLVETQLGRGLLPEDESQLIQGIQTASEALKKQIYARARGVRKDPEAAAKAIPIFMALKASDPTEFRYRGELGHALLLHALWDQSEGSQQRAVTLQKAEDELAGAASQVREKTDEYWQEFLSYELDLAICRMAQQDRSEEVQEKIRDNLSFIDQNGDLRRLLKNVASDRELQVTIQNWLQTQSELPEELKGILNERFAPLSLNKEISVN